MERTVLAMPVVRMPLSRKQRLRRVYTARRRREESAAVQKYGSRRWVAEMSIHTSFGSFPLGKHPAD